MEPLQTETTRGDRPRTNFLLLHVNQYLGIILILISTLFVSLTTVLVKLLNEDENRFNSFSSAFWRSTGVTIPSMMLLIYYVVDTKLKNNDSIFATVWPLQFCGATRENSKNSEKWWALISLMVAAILAGSGLILRYLALEYLTIADTTVITFATPVFVTIMAHVFLREKCGVVPILAAVIALLGIAIITRPPILTGATEFDTNILVGTSYALAHVVFSALILIITRKIRNVHFSLTTCTFGVIGIIVSVSLATTLQFLDIPFGNYQVTLVSLLMILAFFGQMTVILAVKFEQAGPVSLLQCSSVIYGLIFQYIFLGVEPDLLSLVGGTMVLSCVVITGLRKWVSTLSDDSKHRKRLKYLLL